MRLPVRQSFIKSMGIFIVVATLMSGCASYQSKPLNDEISLPDKVQQLTGAPQQQATLDAYQVATIALLNNPDLKVSRAQLRVNQAQLFNAKLFADPQLSANLDQPTTSSSGLVNAWGIGLSYDVLSLITHNSQVKIVSFQKQQAQLEMEWQEWQVIQQARILVVKSLAEQRELKLLASSLSLYQQRYQRSELALEQGNATIDTVSTDLTSLVDLTSQTSRLAQAHSETQQALSSLMGLDSRVVITLKPSSMSSELNEKELMDALHKLPTVRADLRALKAGYESQETKVYQAILGQFPAINIGFNHASDTSGVVTNGLGISINLPIFNGNKGMIAQERATRHQLQLVYQNRLNQASNQVHDLVGKQHLLQQQLANLTEFLPKLQSLVEQARPAYNNGEMDALVFINLENSWIQKQLEKLTVQQQLAQVQIALDTLLAVPFPPTLLGEQK